MFSVLCSQCSYSRVCVSSLFAQHLVYPYPHLFHSAIKVFIRFLSVFPDSLLLYHLHIFTCIYSIPLPSRRCFIPCMSCVCLSSVPLYCSNRFYFFSPPLYCSVACYQLVTYFTLPAVASTICSNSSFYYPLSHSIPFMLIPLVSKSSKKFTAFFATS